MPADMTAERDQANLDAVLAIVREHCPHAVAIHLETSDQGRYGYGFVLTRITEESPSAGLYHRRAPEDALTADLEDQVADLLCDLDWNGVVGENPHGYARIELETT